MIKLKPKDPFNLTLNKFRSMCLFPCYSGVWVMGVHNDELSTLTMETPSFFLENSIMNVQTLSPRFNHVHHCIAFIALYKNDIRFWENARI